MTNKLLDKTKDIPSAPSFLLVFLFLALHSCTPVAVKHPHRPPFSEQTINDILLSMKKQEDSVDTFFSYGKVTFKGNDSEFEANVLAVGTRIPYRIKIEITHFWGRPLFHITIKGSKIHVLSFPEEVYYTDDIENLSASNLLPIRLDKNMLWAAGRGFPVLSGYNTAKSFSENKISLVTINGDISQILEFYPESRLPKTALSKQGIQVSFSEFEKNDNIQFAEKTTLFDYSAQTMLILDFNKMVFNKTIDNSIFDFVTPSNFKFYQNTPCLDTK